MFHRNNLQPISYKTIYCVLYCVCYVMLSSVCGSGRKSLGTVKYFSCFFSACGAVCVCLWSVRSLSSLLNVYSCKLRRRQFSVRVTSLSLSLSLSLTRSRPLSLLAVWLSAVWSLSGLGQNLSWVSSCRSVSVPMSSIFRVAIRIQWSDEVLINELEYWHGTVFMPLSAVSS